MLHDTEEKGDAARVNDADSLSLRVRNQFSELEHNCRCFTQGSVVKAGDEQFWYDPIIPMSTAPDSYDAVARSGA